MVQYLKESDFEQSRDARSAGWDEDGWYFWDETQANCYGPYETEVIANTKLGEYCEQLNAYNPNK